MCRSNRNSEISSTIEDDFLRTTLFIFLGDNYKNFTLARACGKKSAELGTFGIFLFFQ